LDLQSIVAELKRERDRLSRAIAELESEEADSSPVIVQSVTASSNTKALGDQRGRGLTPEGRKRLSEAVKQRWAQRRKKPLISHTPVS
jgi:hypothetical protein